MPVEFDPDATQDLSPTSIGWIQKNYPNWVKDGVPMLPGGIDNLRKDCQLPFSGSHPKGLDYNFNISGPN